jgi:hypothetical protein
MNKRMNISVSEACRVAKVSWRQCLPSSWGGDQQLEQVESQGNHASSSPKPHHCIHSCFQARQLYQGRILHLFRLVRTSCNRSGPSRDGNCHLLSATMLLSLIRRTRVGRGIPIFFRHNLPGGETAWRGANDLCSTCRLRRWAVSARFPYDHPVTQAFIFRTTMQPERIS